MSARQKRQTAKKKGVSIVLGEDFMLGEEQIAGVIARGFLPAFQAMDALWKNEYATNADQRAGWIAEAFIIATTEILPEYAAEALGQHYGREALARELGGEVDKKAASSYWRKAIDPPFATIRSEIVAEIETNAENMANKLYVDGLEPEGVMLHYATAAATHATLVVRRLIRRYIEEGHPITESALVASLKRPSGPPTTISLATNAVALELQRGLLQDATKTHDATIHVRESSKKKRLKVRTRLDLEPLRAKNRDDVLETMYRRLRDIKRDGAAALKLHLDLMDQAWKTGGELPIFTYTFSEALDRQGYERHEGRRAFHDKTTRDLRERLALLRSYTVQSWTEKKGGRLEQEIVATPYWIVEGYHYTIQEPLDFDLDDDVYPVVMRDKSAPKYHAVTIRPGLWWKLTDMSRARLDLPAGILGLSTSHERERMALLIATFLAIHVRRNHQKHAGKRVTIKVGTLLEQANVTTREEFMSEHAELAKRRREYLDDLEDGGALATIRRLNAFDVRIEEEAEYQATGRGWRERFWDARLSVAVPVLDIDRSIPKL